MPLTSNFVNPLIDSNFAQKSEPVVRMADGGIMDLMPQQQAPRSADPQAELLFSQMRQGISPKEFSDEMLSSAEQVDPKAVAEFRSALEELDAPPEILDLLNTMVDEILANPGNYEEIRRKYMAQGVTEDVLPQEFDPIFFGALNVAVDQMRGEPAGPQAFARGGIAQLTPIAKSIASYGRNGDTMLAHITPAEARMLKKRGGAGTINPVTKLPEYWSIGGFFKKIGNAIKGFAQSTIGRVAIGAALAFFVGPVAASMMGVSSAAGVAAVSGFVGGAGSTLAAGGDLRDALKAGVTGALVAGVGTGIQGGSEAFEAGSYKGPTTFGGQVDKAAEYFSPGSTQPTLQNQPVLAGTEAPAAAAAPAPAAATPATTVEGLQRVEVTAPTFKPDYSLLPKTSASQLMAPGAAAAAPVAAPAAVPPPAAMEPDYGVTNRAVQDIGAERFGTAPTATQAMENIQKGYGAPIASPETSFYDRVKGIAKEYFSPSDIEAAGISDAEKAATAARNRFLQSNPNATGAELSRVYEREYNRALPGMFQKYGPLTAAGLGIMGLTGGFEAKPASTNPYQQYMLDQFKRERDMLAANPNMFALQGFPAPILGYGGTRYTTTPPPPPPSVTIPTVVPPSSGVGFADGGSVSYPEMQALYWKARNAAILSGTDPSTLAPPPVPPAAQDIYRRIPGGKSRTPVDQRIVRPVIPVKAAEVVFNQSAQASKNGPDEAAVAEKRAGGIASLGTGGYPRRTGQIDGPGTETSDSIPAMLSDGEFVMTAKAVRGAGNGSRRAGAKKMYALMHRLERNASRG